MLILNVGGETLGPGENPRTHGERDVFRGEQSLTRIFYDALLLKSPIIDILKCDFISEGKQATFW